VHLALAYIKQDSCLSSTQMRDAGNTFVGPGQTAEAETAESRDYRKQLQV
jgi:hypothetical protein